MLVYCTLKCGLHIEIYIILDTFDFVCILLILFFAISLTVVGKKLLWKRVVCDRLSTLLHLWLYPDCFGAKRV